MIRRYLAFVLFLFLALGASSSKIEKLSDQEIRKLADTADVVILNFWATWCAPCVEEIPAFVKVQERFKDIKVIGVSMDDLHHEPLIHKFLTKHPVNYRVVLWGGNDLEKLVNLIDPKWPGPIPATFIFRKGERIYSKVGPITEQELVK